MSEHQKIKPKNLELVIRELMSQLQTANSHVEKQPLKACEIFTQIIAEANSLTETIPSTGFAVLQEIQQTAGDNLVQAALMATSPNEINDVIPMLSGKMDRLNNLLNLGFYLQEHQVTVEIDQQKYTAAYCAEAASQLAPDNEIAKKLLALALSKD